MAEPEEAGWPLWFVAWKWLQDRRKCAEANRRFLAARQRLLESAEHRALLIKLGSR